MSKKAKKSKKSKKSNPKININEEIAKRVLEVVDKGLTDGVGSAIPGQMCVEAAVCYAMGEPHTDKPKCVEKEIRNLKIELNDSDIWRSNTDRATGLRRLAIAQLGSKDVVKGDKFVRAVEKLALTKYVPMHFNLARKEIDEVEKLAKSLTTTTGKKRNKILSKLEDMNDVILPDLDYSLDDGAVTMVNQIIENIHPVNYRDGTSKANNKVLKAQQKMLEEFCEDVVQILIQLKSPGCQFLYLTEKPAA